MMTSNLTYKELINYLDLYSTDPMVRKLLEYINDKEENIIEGLVEVGMDEDGRIEGDNGWHLPGPYIRELRHDVDYYQTESNEWQEKYEDMKAERDKLKARSVAELLEEMNNLVRRARADQQEAERTATVLKSRNAELEEKINVWKVMES